MNSVLSPLVSEFDTQEHEASHTVWLKAKVEKSLIDPRPNVPHDQVMADMRTLLLSKKNDASR